MLRFARLLQRKIERSVSVGWFKICYSDWLPLTSTFLHIQRATRFKSEEANYSLMETSKPNHLQLRMQPMTLVPSLFPLATCLCWEITAITVWMVTYGDFYHERMWLDEQYSFTGHLGVLEMKECFRTCRRIPWLKKTDTLNNVKVQTSRLKIGHANTDISIRALFWTTTIIMIF